MTGDRMAGMKYIKLFYDQWVAFEPLSLEERGRLITALFAVANGYEVDEADLGNARFVWGILHAQFVRDRADYQKLCEVNRCNGMSGGRPRKASGLLENRSVFPITQKCQDEEEDDEKDNEEDHEKVRDAVKKHHSTSQRRFTPPTLDDVVAYCKNRNSPIDPKRFWEYYNEGKWRDGTGKPVKCWKQKILSWERDELGGKNGRDTTSGKTETSRTWGDVI